MLCQIQNTLTSGDVTVYCFEFRDVFFLAHEVSKSPLKCCFNICSMQGLHRHKCDSCWVIAAVCTVFEPLCFVTAHCNCISHPFISPDIHLYLLFILTPSIHPSTHSFLSFVSLPPSLSLPVTPSPPSPPNTGQIGKPWWRHRSWGRSYLSQTDQEVCDGGVDGCCRSVTLAGARQAGPHGSGTVGLQTDGTWWVTNN